MKIILDIWVMAMQSLTVVVMLTIAVVVVVVLVWILAMVQIICVLADGDQQHIAE